MTILSSGEAIGRLRADRDILLARVDGLTEEQLGSEYLVDSRPLGDFCRSLHDLVAHVLMWDEINLSVLAEAAAGREHWSLDPRWEDPAVGRSLNIGGVEAGRHLSPALLLHRFGAVHDAILDDLGRVGEEAWEGVGALAQRVWTVPGNPAYWHAAIHLGAVPPTGS
ncbi:DinB family protein [Nonomuraea sp. NPDC050663]|uniref:DinB family protein n=1 Tax=Nonomuraea sp. NPDC050663 TaxID=3364370 RepID=UPI0037887C1F